MSGPRIKVRLGHSPVLRKIHNAWVNQGWRRKFYWHCTGCTPSQFESNGGTADTLAAAADAGREHMRRFHYDKEAVVFAALDEYAADHPERFVSCTQPEHECCVAHTCCVCATPRTERSHADA